jgi:hypothetical protein
MAVYDARRSEADVRDIVTIESLVTESNSESVVACGQQCAVAFAGDPFVRSISSGKLHAGMPA